MQDLTFGLVEVLEFYVDQFLQPFQIAMDNILSLNHVNCTTQLDVSCKAEDALIERQPLVWISLE